MNPLRVFLLIFAIGMIPFSLGPWLPPAPPDCICHGAGVQPNCLAHGSADSSSGGVL